jgi:hypothetical protein
VTASATK